MKAISEPWPIRGISQITLVTLRQAEGSRIEYPDGLESVPSRYWAKIG
jgi:hypothetical protein